MAGKGADCVKTIFENQKWKIAASLWLLSLVEWVIQVNISSIINQLWEKGSTTSIFGIFTQPGLNPVVLKSGDIIGFSGALQAPTISICQEVVDITVRSF